MDAKKILKRRHSNLNTPKNIAALDKYPLNAEQLADAFSILFNESNLLLTDTSRKLLTLSGKYSVRLAKEIVSIKDEESFSQSYDCYGEDRGAFVIFKSRRPSITPEDIISSQINLIVNIYKCFLRSDFEFDNTELIKQFTGCELIKTAIDKIKPGYSVLLYILFGQRSISETVLDGDYKVARVLTYLNYNNSVACDYDTDTIPIITTLNASLDKALDSDNYKSLISIVIIILQQKACPHSHDKNKRTLLHYAVELGSLNLLATLLSKGVDYNMQDIDGWTALHLAIKKGDIAIINYLLNLEGLELLYLGSSLGGISGLNPIDYSEKIYGNSEITTLLKSRFHEEDFSLIMEDIYSMTGIYRPKIYNDEYDIVIEPGKPNENITSILKPQ